MRAAFLLPLLATAALAAPAAAQRVIVAKGNWAALDQGSHCEALSRSELQSAKGRPQARAGFSFDRSGPRRGEFHARLSRTARPGSSVVLTVAGQPFLLATDGEWAWSREPAQAAAIIAAVRRSGDMRVTGRDRAGQRISDRYLLAGAPTAIDAAAAACLPRRR